MVVLDRSDQWGLDSISWLPPTLCPIGTVSDRWRGSHANQQDRSLCCRHFSTAVLGAGTAFAANGAGLILGHSNTETKGTTLTNSQGTALTLNGKAGHPALAVNNETKVKHLNSDLLDGHTAEDFVQKNGHQPSDFLNKVFTGSLAAPVLIKASSGLAPVTVPAGTYLVAAYADIYNPETTEGDYGCYPRYVAGTSSSSGRYMDATVLRYSSTSSQQVVTFAALDNDLPDVLRLHRRRGQPGKGRAGRDHG